MHKFVYRIHPFASPHRLLPKLLDRVAHAHPLVKRRQSLLVNLKPLLA